MTEMRPWPKPTDFEYIHKDDGMGNSYPYVGYQYKMQADYLAALLPCWKERCRLMAQAIDSVIINNPHADHVLADAVKAIGPLPP